MRCFVRHLACVRPQMLRDDHLQRGHSLAATLPSLPLCSQSTRLPSYHCTVEQHGEYEDGDLGARPREEEGEGDCEGHGWKVIKIGIYFYQYHHCNLQKEEPPNIRFVTFALHTSSSLCSRKATFWATFPLAMLPQFAVALCNIMSPTYAWFLGPFSPSFSPR